MLDQIAQTQSLVDKYVVKGSLSEEDTNILANLMLSIPRPDAIAFLKQLESATRKIKVAKKRERAALRKLGKPRRGIGSY